MKVRICVIHNAIFANKVHYPALTSFDDEIVGMCAFNEERLAKTARTFNLPSKNICDGKSNAD